MDQYHCFYLTWMWFLFSTFLLWQPWIVGESISCSGYRLGRSSRTRVQYWYNGMVPAGRKRALNVSRRPFDLQYMQLPEGVQGIHSHTLQSMVLVGHAYESPFCMPSPSWQSFQPSVSVDPRRGCGLVYNREENRSSWCPTLLTALWQWIPVVVE